MYQSSPRDYSDIYCILIISSCPSVITERLFRYILYINNQQLSISHHERLFRYILYIIISSCISHTERLFRYILYINNQQLCQSSERLFRYILYINNQQLSVSHPRDYSDIYCILIISSCISVIREIIQIYTVY